MVLIGINNSNQSKIGRESIHSLIENDNESDDEINLFSNHSSES
jgi:hypothetical protein